MTCLMRCSVSTDYALLCHTTRRRLDMQGEGSVVIRGVDGLVTPEALAVADGGVFGMRVYAALWAREQGHPVYLVSEHADAFDTGLRFGTGLPIDGWSLDTLYGPDRWQKKLRGKSVSIPVEWGVEGEAGPHGMMRFTILG